MNDSIRQRMATWCQPISEDSFCGEPSRYEEDFIQLQEELGRLKSLHDEVCDWEVVYRCADQLLRTKSKDMTVLGALCVALLKREGVEGLTAGLGAYRSLIKTRDAELFPKPNRRRGRAGAFSWLAENLDRGLVELQDSGSDADQETLKICLKIFEELDDLMREQLQELHPRVGPIKAALAAMIEQPSAVTAPAPASPRTVAGHPLEDESAPAPQAVTDPSSEPDAAVAAPPRGGSPSPPTRAPTPAVAPGEAARTGAIRSRVEAEQALDAAVDLLRRSALFHLEADSQDPLGYHLAHLVSFVGVVPGGSRMVSGPDTEGFRGMQAAAEEARWDDVIEQAKEMLRAGPLDLNVECWLTQALEAKGHRMAQETLQSHAMGLRLRMGKRLRGTPDTEQWIERVIGGLSGHRPAVLSDAAGAASEAAPTDGGRNDLDAVIASAAEVSTRSGLGEGCVVIQEALATTAARPDRFRLHLALAGLCVREGASDLARPILQELLEELEQPVRAWDPKLLARVANALLTCDRELLTKADKEARAALDEEANRMLILLARIDPRTAVLERKKR